MCGGPIENECGFRNNSDECTENGCEWKDCGACLQLPRYDSTERYVHHSYKTANKSLWPEPWVFFRESWLLLHPDWTPLFWLDEANELLFNCTHDQYLINLYHSMPKPIMKADISRLLYMYAYGGLYVDMDVLAVQSNEPALFKKYLRANVILQKPDIAVEWAFSRYPGRPFWMHCLKHHANAEEILTGSGPTMVKRCFLEFFKPRGPLVPLRTYGENQDVIVMKQDITTPVIYIDHMSECGRIRQQSNAWYEQNWTSTACYEKLIKTGAIAYTIYSADWF